MLFKFELLLQGWTLVLELGPHKDREKLWPGWDLNPRPSDFDRRCSSDWATGPEREQGVGIWDHMDKLPSAQAS